MRYKSLYISLPSSANHREMAKSAFSEERELRRLIFKILFQNYCGVPDSVSR